MSKKLDALIKDLTKKQPKLIGDIEVSGKVRKLKIPSPQLSYLFGGGQPIGRMIRWRGPESSGKSTLSIYCAAVCQKYLPEYLGQPEKDKVIYVDFERTLDAKYANNLGLDTSPGKFIHLLPDDIESASDALFELIKTDEIAAVIFDSDGQAGSRAQMVDESGKSSFGGAARAISGLLNKIIIVCANYNTTLHWISQERVNMAFGAHLPSCCVTPDTLVDVIEF